jgi:hypothetical protein
MKTSRKTLAAAAASLLSLILVAGISAPASAGLPVPSTVMTCKKIVAATNPAVSFPTHISRVSAASDDEQSYGGIPDANFVQMAGGIACDYSNGRVLDNNQIGSGIGFTVEYLPYAASGYQRWNTAMTGPDDFYCWDDRPGDCLYMTSAGGDWLEIETYGARSDAVAEDLSRRISAALQLGLKTPYVLPTYASPLPRTCPALVSAAAWRAAVGSPMTLVASSREPGWTPALSGMGIVHGFTCEMIGIGGGHGAGQVTALPGGRWAFAAVRSELTTPGPLTAMTVAGMRAGDAAFTRCDALHAHCILDALIATHWVEIDLWSNAVGGDLIHRDRLAASRSLLSDIVNQVYAP